MMKNLTLVIVFFTMFLIGYRSVAEEFTAADGKDLIGIYENLDQFIPEDILVTNESGQLVNMKNLIDKPTVLTLVYYTCPGICSPLLDGVAEVISKADIVLGKDYQVLTVSFNPDETYDLAVSKKKNYIKQVKKQINETAWQWFVADSLNISKLTGSVGFRYKREGKDFIHAAAIMVLSPDGKITRYLYGTYFLPFDLKMAVVEASQGRSGPTINKFLRYCFSYDPEGKKYVFNITRISATIILAGAGALLLYLVLSRKRKPTIKKD